MTKDADDELFRMQVEKAAEFVTATYTFADAELNQYIEQFEDTELAMQVVIGLQALLGFALNSMARLDGTATKSSDENILRKLSEIMLDFNRYDATLD